MTSIISKFTPAQMLRSASQFREYLKTPLYANAYLLIVNQVLSAGLGTLYWMLAARFYSADMVGKSSAIISTLGFLSALAEFSLKSGMQRFVPRAGKHVRSLVSLTYGFVLLVTGLFTVVFLIAGHALHFTDSLLSGMNTPFLVLLTLATMIWTVFIVQDGVLMGLRQTLWVLVENTFYNTGKIVLLLIGISGIISNAIVISWFMPAPLSVLLVNMMVFIVFIPRFSKIKQFLAEPFNTRQMITSVTGDHVGTMLSETSIRLLPLMVINILGTRANAYFYQAWLIGTMLYLVAYNLAASYTVEAASNPKQIRHYSRQTLRHMMVLIIPLSIVLFIAAPYILWIYGSEYASQGTALLRWLALAAVPYSINSWFLSYSRVRADVKSIVFCQGLQCVITLGLGLWWMPLYGISAVGVAWLIAQILVCGIAVLKTGRIIFGKEAIEKIGAVIYPLKQPVGDYLKMVDQVVRLDFDLPGVGLAQPGSLSGGVFVFLSPHLDDAVLSCGGYISRLARTGARVVIVSLFTADVSEDTEVSWLAQRHLRAWRLNGSGSPFVKRCLEDEEAARRLGVEVIHLGLLDALFRRSPEGEFYYTKNTVGVPLNACDRETTGRVIEERLMECVRRYTDGAAQGTTLRIFSPSGIGDHVDHTLVRCCAEAIFGRSELTYYEDFPYAARNHIRVSPANPVDMQPYEAWVLTRVTLTTSEVEARIGAAACYVSQIPGLFPTPIERNLEIITTRAPIFNQSILSLNGRMMNQDKVYQRVEKALENYIVRAGGENYWSVTSSLLSGAAGNGKVYGKAKK